MNMTTQIRLSVTLKPLLSRREQAEQAEAQSPAAVPLIHRVTSKMATAMNEDYGAMNSPRKVPPLRVRAHSTAGRAAHGTRRRQRAIASHSYAGRDQNVQRRLYLLLASSPSAEPHACSHLAGQSEGEHEPSPPRSVQEQGRGDLALATEQGRRELQRSDDRQAMAEGAHAFLAQAPAAAPRAANKCMHRQRSRPS